MKFKVEYQATIHGSATVDSKYATDEIDAMARAANDGTESLELTRRDIIDALRAAEQAGWRLVPVEPTQAMRIAESRFTTKEQCGMVYTTDGDAWNAMLQAAPRPWEEA